jgi:hypothetical protein
MSLLPPPASKSEVGRVWVDPITAHKFVFTGENVDKPGGGWVPLDLQNERYEYERAE